MYIFIYEYTDLYLIDIYTWFNCIYKSFSLAIFLIIFKEQHYIYIYIYN